MHSCIYYHFDGSLVTDAQWQEWANELVALQKKYPLIAKRVDYHKWFKNFDGTTGFDLPINRPEIIRKARWLLSQNNRRRK